MSAGAEVFVKRFWASTERDKAQRMADQIIAHGYGVDVRDADCFVEVWRTKNSQRKLEDLTFEAHGSGGFMILQRISGSLIPIAKADREEDAKLFAASPKLLEALQRFAIAGGSKVLAGETFTMTGADVIFARAAIAEAGASCR